MILITGGNGFLGHHIRQEFDRQHIQYFAPKSKTLDLLDFDDLCSYLSYYKPTAILHMAAVCAGIVGNKAEPATFLFKNTQMALNIYEAARLNNITNIYSLGSVCSYGDKSPLPFCEDTLWEGGAPQKTNLGYSQAKRTLMLLEQTYREQYGFTGAHLIPVNLFGTHDSFEYQKSHVVPALIKKIDEAIENGSNFIECLGTGTAYRELLYVGDCSQAITKAVATHLDSALPINLGTGKDISIKALAGLLASKMGFKGSIVFRQDDMDGQQRRLLNCDRARQLLSWEASTSLEDGLQQTIDWYRANKHLFG